MQKLKVPMKRNSVMRKNQSSRAINSLVVLTTLRNCLTVHSFSLPLFWKSFSQNYFFNLGIDAQTKWWQNQDPKSWNDLANTCKPSLVNVNTKFHVMSWCVYNGMMSKAMVRISLLLNVGWFNDSWSISKSTYNSLVYLIL